MVVDILSTASETGSELSGDDSKLFASDENHQQDQFQETAK